MTDYTDLITRLRSAYVTASPDEAADALEEIAASREAVWKHAKMLEKDLLAHKERIAELEAALRPFADAANRSFKGSHSDVVDYIDEYIVVKRGELRAARAALEKKND